MKNLHFLSYFHLYFEHFRKGNSFFSKYIFKLYYIYCWWLCVCIYYRYSCEIVYQCSRELFNILVDHQVLLRFWQDKKVIRPRVRNPEGIVSLLSFRFIAFSTPRADNVNIIQWILYRYDDVEEVRKPGRTKTKTNDIRRRDRL